MAYQESDANAGMAERGIGWIFAVVGLALGAIGLLRGFGIVGTEGVDIPGIGDAGGLQAAVQSDFWEAIVWMLPGFGAAIIAWAMNGARTYRMEDTRSPARMSAYVMVVVSIAAGVLALLVGFDLLGQGTNPLDGVLWGMATVLTSLVSAAMYVTAPSPAAETDYLVRVVEARVGRAQAAGTPASGTMRRGTEPLG